MPTEQEVAEYLKRDFNADAAILVGSRADGAARLHSDWDCYVLVDDGAGPRGPIPEPRELNGARLDVGIVHLPIGTDEIVGVFGPNLQQARVLFDTPTAALQIINSARAIYATGRHLSDAEKHVRAHQMARNIPTMIERQDQPGASFEALAFVFYVSHRYWYEVIHRRYSQSVHRAMPEIQAEDPDFYADLILLTAFAPVATRIRSAQRLYSRLFGEWRSI